MILFYFLIFVLPLSQHHIWAQFVGDLTGIKYIGIVCLPYAIFHLAQRKALPRFFVTWQARLFIVLSIFAFLSYLAFGRIPMNLSHCLTYASFLAFFFITVSVVDTRSRMRWVVLSGIGSIGLASAYVLRDWQTHRGLYADYRPGWVVGDPNYFTVNALLFMPVALLLLQQKQPRWQRLFCLGCLTLSLAAVLVSASRGGFLGLVASSLYFLLKSRHRHPLLGVGLDNYSSEITKYADPAKVPKYETVRRVAHNSYMEIAAELGVPALFIFLGIIISSSFSLDRVRRAALKSSDDLLGRVALGLQGGILGASVALFFVSGEYQKMFWMAIFLTTCMPALARSKSIEASAVVPRGQGLDYSLTADQRPVVAVVPGGRNISSWGK